MSRECVKGQISLILSEKREQWGLFYFIPSALRQSGLNLKCSRHSQHASLKQPPRWVLPSFYSLGRSLIQNGLSTSTIRQNNCNLCIFRDTLNVIFLSYKLGSINWDALYGGKTTFLIIKRLHLQPSGGPKRGEYVLCEGRLISGLYWSMSGY